MTQCEECSDEFEPKHKNHSYCSSGCRDKSRRRRRDNEQMKDYRAAWRARQGDSLKRRMREYHLNYKYGLSQQAYDEMLEAQGGVCAICLKKETIEGRSLAVDHDHTTGEIKGLLCWFCNHKFIGNIRDPEMFARASDFLKKTTGLFIPKKEPNVQEIK